MMWIYLSGFLAVVVTLTADFWFDIDYRLAANLSLIYIAGLVTVFTILYWRRSRWRSNYVGKAFLVKGALLAAVLWQAVAAVWIDTDYPGRHVIRFVIYSLGAVAYLVMLIILAQEQKRDREVTHPPDPS